MGTAQSSFDWKGKTSINILIAYVCQTDDDEQYDALTHLFPLIARVTGSLENINVITLRDPKVWGSHENITITNSHDASLEDFVPAADEKPDWIILCGTTPKTSAQNILNESALAACRRLCPDGMISTFDLVADDDLSKKCFDDFRAATELVLADDILEIRKWTPIIGPSDHTQ